MNYFSTITVALLSCCLCAGKLFAASPEIEKARLHGAEGQVTFRVIDSVGKPVENAEMRATFPHSDAYGDISVLKGPTDTKGIFVAAGNTVDSVIYDIKKRGYYTTGGEYRFYRRGESCVKNGRWQPWNPTHTVVLKEHRNPSFMYAKRVEIVIPIMDQPIGFDLEKGDWVSPHGQGIRSDLIIKYLATYEGPQVFSKQLEIRFANAKDGLQNLSADKTSEFISLYNAPENGYLSSLVLAEERTRIKIIKCQELKQDEYIVFRVRTICEDKGNIVSANYGKIYGPFDYGLIAEQHRLIFNYYFNPTPNDRNIEFDPSKNLFYWSRGEPGFIHMP